MPNLQTLRGTIANLKFIETIGNSIRRYTDKLDNATEINFEINGHVIAMINKGLPPLHEGDDVEVSGAPNPRSGGLEVGKLINHTTGEKWDFNPWLLRR